MSLSADRFMKDYTPTVLMGEVMAIIEETLSGKWPDDTPLTGFVTVGQFREMKDTYYGSKLVLKELCGMYSARRLRMWVININPGMKPEAIQECMNRTEVVEWTAVRLLQEELTKRHGPVSADEVKRLDEMARGWEEEAQKRLGM